MAAAHAAPASAADYFVSPSGNDSRSGTSPSEAWRTVQRVNNQALQPGDRVFFEGGATFAGNLYIGPDDATTAAAPITVGSYGTGRATIDAGTGTGVLVYDIAGVRVQDLRVVGSGRDTNTGQGIFFYNDLPGDVLLPFVRIERVEVSGFGEYGILIGGWNNGSGFSDVRIAHATVRDNRLGGIFTYAYLRNVHRNVYVGYSSSFRNSGAAGLTYNSGNGIALSGVNGGVIERSVAWGNGWLSDAGNGPIGIWAFDSTNVLIQFNESYGNRTGGQKDGGGFCLDMNVSNSIVQYNYSHDNAGAGYLLAHKPDNYEHTNNVVRYNISENDGRRNDYAAIHTWGRIRNAQIHNNTVFITPTPSGTPGLPRAILIKNSSITLQDPENLYFRNNIIQTTGGIRLIEAQASALDGAINLRFEGNDYYTTGGSFRIVWGSTTYSSLDAWRTATRQERVGTTNTGMTVDPRLLRAGQGTTYGDATLIGALYGYRLSADSLLIAARHDLRALGVDPGPRDYFGGSLADGGRPDVGAHEFIANCNWSLTPQRVAATVDGGAGTIDVYAGHPTCGWAAQSTAAWLTVEGAAGGSGAGGVSYRVASNTGSSRTGTIQIADQVFTVEQQGAVSEEPPPPPPPPSGSSDEIVLYASQAPVVAGAWSVTDDSTAAGGARLQNPNAGAAKIDTALASPANYFELTFNADAGKGYRLWIRGKAISNSYANDSVHVQFSGSVTSSGAATWRIGTTSATVVNIEDCSGCGLSGWGWQDNGYGSGVLGPLVYFAASGPQTIRIQVREDGLGIDQVVLSASQYLTTAPGALKNDTTILPATSGGDDGGGGGEEPPPPSTSGDIVLYAAEAPIRTGAWNIVSDSSAAGGSRLQNPDAGAAKIDAAQASPANYFELTFEAQAGTAYRLWLRGKATSNYWANDSVHVQFSGSVDSGGGAVWRIGTTSSTVVNLEDCSGCGLAGWGWQDNGYGSGVLGPLVYFATTGTQTIRIQVREDGLGIDQIVLSPSTYLNSAPGSLKNDSTILPKS